MATKQALAVGIRIGATDEASGVIAGMVNKANMSLRGLVGGLAGMGAGEMARRFTNKITEQFSNQEYSLANLRIMEMNRLGKVNEEVYGKEEAFIKDLSNRYAKSVEEYTNMAVVLRQNRITSSDFMGGIGEVTAKLGKVFDNMEPRVAALFFARLKNDMRVGANEMEHLANMAFKLKNIGVGGGDANATINELTEAYSKAGLGATNLGLAGVKDAEELGILMGTFIAKGISGQSTGTNFRRIFDGLRDPARYMKVSKLAAQYGVDVSFYDGHGKFKGLRDFQEQLGKIGKLSTAQRAEVLKPFAGKQGLSIDFLEYLSAFGHDVEELRSQYTEGANLEPATSELLKTTKILEAKTLAAKENMQAAFGKTIAEDVKRFNGLLTDTFHWVTGIVAENPNVSKFALEVVGIGAGLASIIGGLKVLGTMNATFAAIGAGLSTAFGPIMLAAGAALIVKGMLDYGSTKADEQLADNPNSRRNKKIAEWNEIINDPESGMFKRNFFRFKKGIRGINNEVFGDTSEGSKYASPSENLQNRNSINYSSPINYSPVINANGISQESINNILKQNSDALLQKLQQEQRRQSNMTYGAGGHMP